MSVAQGNEAKKSSKAIDNGDALLGSTFLDALRPEGTRWDAGYLYYTRGRMTDFTIFHNKATARAVGTFDNRESNTIPLHRTSLRFKTISEDEAASIQKCARRCHYFPEVDLKKLFQDKRPALLPHNILSIIICECKCDDWLLQKSYYGSYPRGDDEPCKHIAGLIFKLSDALDKDPSLLFEMRGVHLWSEDPPDTPKTLPAPKRPRWGKSKCDPVDCDCVPYVVE